MISGGMKRTLKKPIKAALFLLLIVVTVTFLSIGVYLFINTSKSIEDIERMYRTIGTVEQINRTTVTTKSYDRVYKKYRVELSQSYDETVSIDELNFEGANYIYPPENRPFYNVETDSMFLYSGMMKFDQLPVVEFKIAEKYENLKTVRGEAINSINGISFKTGTPFYIFQHIGEDEFYWDLNKEYITMLETNTHCQSSGEYWKNDFGYWPDTASYSPNLILSSWQIDKQGKRLDDEPFKETEELGIIEVSEGLYNTELWRRFENINAGGKARETQIRVIPTNSLSLLMDFYNKEAYFVDGRTITDEEFAEGKPVCIIQEDMATGNDLKVGDTIDMSYISSIYGGSLGGFDFPLGSDCAYRSSVNAKGDLYEPFFKEDYEIVGIYKRLSNQKWFLDTQENYGVGYGTIIVPSKSITESDENNMNGDLYLKPYNVSFEIPNGTSGAYMEKVRALGLDKKLSFTFYDGGYDNIKQGLDDMREMAVILLLSGGITSLAALFFFTFIFIGKEKRSIAVERSLGLTKGKSALSMMLGVLMVVTIGAGVGTAVGAVASQRVYEGVELSTQEEGFDTSYSNWANIFAEGDEGLTDEQVAGTQEIEENQIDTSILLAIIVFISVVGVEVIIAYFFISNNLKQEPIKLLSSQ